MMNTTTDMSTYTWTLTVHIGSVTGTQEYAKGLDGRTTNREAMEAALSAFRFAAEQGYRPTLTTHEWV